MTYNSYLFSQSCLGTLLHFISSSPPSPSHTHTCICCSFSSFILDLSTVFIFASYSCIFQQHTYLHLVHCHRTLSLPYIHVFSLSILPSPFLSSFPSHSATSKFSFLLISSSSFSFRLIFPSFFLLFSSLI